MTPGDTPMTTTEELRAEIARALIQFDYEQDIRNSEDNTVAVMKPDYVWKHFSSEYLARADVILPLLTRLNTSPTAQTEGVPVAQLQDDPAPLPGAYEHIGVDGDAIALAGWFGRAMADRGARRFYAQIRDRDAHIRRLALEESARLVEASLFSYPVPRKKLAASIRALAHPPSPPVQTPRFDKTFCSQCGGEFGPGDHGFSHCSDHKDES